MPEKAMHFCNHHGCPELVSNGYCDRHKAERDIEYAEKRKKDAEPYDARWNRVRHAYLTRHPLCEQCNRQGRTERAVLVHHIKEIKKGGAMYDPANLMALCNACHEATHGADRWKRRV